MKDLAQKGLIKGKALSDAFGTADYQEAYGRILKGITPSKLQGENKISRDVIDGIVSNDEDFATWAQSLKVEHLRAINMNYDEDLRKAIDGQFQKLKTSTAPGAHERFAEFFGANKTLVRDSASNLGFRSAGYTPIATTPASFKSYETLHGAYVAGMAAYDAWVSGGSVGPAPVVPPVPAPPI